MTVARDDGAAEAERGLRLARPNRPLVVGVVGCGYWGSKHLRVLPTVEGVGGVVAIDANPQVASALAVRHPNVQVASSLLDCLDQLDAVVVATPPRTHSKVARTALEAGCHVLVEKPLATSTAEAEEMVELADYHGLVLMSGHTFEHNPAVWKLKELVAAGELGSIHHVYTARLNLGLYQGDVNVLWDLAPHDLSILNYLLDDVPTAVAAWAGAHAHRHVEDVAYLRLVYGRRGIETNVHVSWIDPCKVRRVTVVGSSKMAVYDDLLSDERVKVYDKGVADEAHHGAGSADTVDLSRRPAAYRDGGSESPFIDFEEPLLIEDRRFVEAIVSGVEPLADGRSGLAVVQVLAAAEESLRRERMVEIDYSPLLARVDPVGTAAGGGW